MKKNFLMVWLLVLPYLVFAQGSSSSSYRLVWKTMDGGGAETPALSSASYRLSFCLGQSTPVGHNRLHSTSASYQLYPGFRMVDLDLRFPYSWFISGLTYISDSTFVLRWAGVDTTSEDGEGWGIWRYDLQYRTSPTGIWTDWLVGTRDTSGTFTGRPGLTYYFRIRAWDLATNVAPWDSAHQDTTLVDYKVDFSVVVSPGGDPLTSSNFIVLTYYSVSPTTQVRDTLWSGESATVYVLPGTNATMTQLSNGSGANQRWSAATAPFWTVNDRSPRQATYYHQYLPQIYLEGTDASHSVSTEAHTQFAAAHLEPGQHTLWSDWADKSSIVRFSEYTTGVPPSVALDDREFTINSALLDTVHYRIANVNITVRNDFGGQVIVDGITRPSPYTVTWNYGSSHTVETSEYYYPSTDSLTRYHFDYWSDSRPRSHTVVVISDSIFTASFIQELRLDVTSAYGTPNPTVGRHYYPVGANVTGYVNLVDNTAHKYCTGFTGTGNLSGGGTDTTFNIPSLSLPSTITWQWGNMLSLIVTSPYGTPTPSGTTYYIPNTDITATVQSLYYRPDSLLRATCTGWLGTGSVLATGLTNTTNFIITANSSITWNWAIEVRFEVFNPGGYDTPSPSVGRHWYEPGVSVSGRVTTPSGGFICVGWTGTGSLPSGSGPEFHFTIVQPSSVSWIWQTAPPRIYSLIVISPYGTPMPRDTTWYPDGLNVTATVQDTVYDVTDGIRHLVTGWTGTGSVPVSGFGSRVTFQILEDSRITWNWRHQYRFTVSNPGDYDTPSPAVGSYWYDDAVMVYGSVDERVDTMVCLGYTGTGSLPDGSNNHFAFEIRTPSSVTWNWISVSRVYGLVVISPFDSPTPSDTSFYTNGTIVNARVDSIVDAGLGRHRICDGWIGSGSVQTFGSRASMTFPIEMNSQIEWLWHTEYQISLAYVGVPSVTQTGAGYYEEETMAHITSQQVVENAGVHYVFHHWSSNPPGALIIDSLQYSTDVHIDTTYTLTAHYTSGVRLTIRKSPLENWGGTILDNDTTNTVAQVDYWVIPGTIHSIGVTSPDVNSGSRYVFTSWSDGGAVVHNVTVPRDTTFIANYNKEQLLSITKDPTGDTLGWVDIDRVQYPGVSHVELWVPDGSSHTVSVSSPDTNANYKYVFNNWSDGGGIGHTVGPLTSGLTMTAFYKVYYRCWVIKDPAQNYGAIAIGGITYDRVFTKDFWARRDSSYVLGVSFYDAAPETIYIFNIWDGGIPSDTSFTTPHINAPDTFIAHYNFAIARLCFNVSTNIWDIDTVNLGYTKTMSPANVIQVVNDCGNVALDLGLFIADPGRSWLPGYANGRNTFVLRARFDDELNAPTYFSPGRDYIKTQVVWADAITFGPKGFNILPPPAVDNKDNMWLQFIAPTETMDYTEQVIWLVLRAKPRLE